MSRVACAQLAPSIGDLDANVEVSTAAVRRCVAAGADVVVLPELVTSGYVFASQDEAQSVAVSRDHAVFDGWAAELAPGGVVVGGFCEQGDDGLLYNSAAVVDATGMRGVYRKVHLWDREKLFFTPGGDHPPVVETVHGRIGVVVCYDLEFPEWTRTVALAGADLIVVPTNWPLVERPADERPPEVVIAMATARVNHVAVACCDRAGVERGQEWTRGTTIIGADGWVLAATQEEADICVELDLPASRDKKLTEHAHLMDDRRPDLYAGVAGRT